MATENGEKFLRTHTTSRGITANTIAADISYDTAVFDEGGFVGTSTTCTVDTAGKYLTIFDLGQCDVSSNRACGILVPTINGIQQTIFRATHRYLRNSGGTMGASIGHAILDLAVSDIVRVRNPAIIDPTDAVGNYATNAGYGGGFQMVYLGTGKFTFVKRDVDANEVGMSDINLTRPWADSDGTWVQITFNSEVQDDDSLYGGSGGNVTLKAGKKYMIVWGTTCYSTGNLRHTYITRLVIDGQSVQTGSGYQRQASNAGPPMNGMYLHEVTGGDVTIKLEATAESEGGDAGTGIVSDAYLQIMELSTDAEWIHADNGIGASLFTALAGITIWYDTPLTSILRVEGDGILDTSATDDGIVNKSDKPASVLAIGWHRWDRDSGSSGARKMPWTRWDNGGSKQAHGVAGAFSRGSQADDDTWQAHYCSSVVLDIGAGEELKFTVNDPAHGANSNMGIYGVTSRYYQGVQVLNLATLVDPPPPAGSTRIFVIS